MTRNLMNAESQMPRTDKIKKQTEICCNNRMQVFFYSETLSDGLKSYLGKQYKNSPGREICCAQNLLLPVKGKRKFNKGLLFCF
jgi:hypothetical protein